jgi:hypothetical protein
MGGAAQSAKVRAASNAKAGMKPLLPRLVVSVMISP